MCAGLALLLWGAHHSLERGSPPAAAWPPPTPVPAPQGSLERALVTRRREALVPPAALG